MMRLTYANGKDEYELLGQLRDRGEAVDKKVSEAVAGIIGDVRARGDEALREYTARFDGYCPEDLEVSRDEINDALSSADPEYVQALLSAQENITEFHTR